MGFVANIEEAGKVADAISKMLALLDKLTPDKAVVVTVRNETGSALRLVSHEHSSGGFAELPSAIIQSGQVDVFGSKDDGLAQGTQGKATYESDAGVLFEIGWNNPFGPGDPNSTSRVVAPSPINFQAVNISGVGDTAQMQYILRPGTTEGLIARKGTAKAGEVSQIAPIKSGRNTLLTAARDGDGDLLLIQWRVDDDGTMHRVADSGSAASGASSIAIARGRLFVTAFRSASDNLMLISWDVSPARIERRGDSRDASDRDAAGEASSIKIVALSESLFLTAARTGSGNLLLISWKLEENGELSRVADSGEQASDAAEIALTLASPDGSGNHRVVTAVTAPSHITTGIPAGPLTMISWRVTGDGKEIRRVSFNHDQAGAGSLVQIVATLPNQLVTSLRSASGTLLVIAWLLEPNGVITRLGDGVAGSISSNSLMPHRGGVLSAVQAADGLRLVKWSVSPLGAVQRATDSGSQAGSVRLVTLPETALDGSASIVTAAATTDKELILISWSDT